MATRNLLHDATLIADEDAALWCRSCTSTAEEGSSYCAHCASYWQDIDNGLFDETFESEGPAGVSPPTDTGDTSK